MSLENVLGAIFSFLGLMSPIIMYFSNKVGKKMDKMVEALTSIERQNVLVVYKVEQNTTDIQSMNDKIEQNTTDIKTTNNKIENVVLKVTQLEAKIER